MQCAVVGGGDGRVGMGWVRVRGWGTVGKGREGKGGGVRDCYLDDEEKVKVLTVL